jgi:tetratricopeptide (TPR) repeat protein
MRHYAALVGVLFVGVAAADEPVAAVTVDSLTRAAECLDRGDNAGALPHLRAHVRAHPGAVMIRAHLAEVLYRLGKADEARTQFERVVADAQPLSGGARKLLVHWHTRIMEIAQAANDDYAENLNRGIGLVLLVRRWDAEPGRRDEAAAERTLVKALAALRAAREARPDDARANLYIADALERLGQVSAARAARHAARAALPDASVTDTERERMETGLMEEGGIGR